MPLNRALPVATALVASLVTVAARAEDPTPQRCTEAYVAGQHLQREGHLLDAAKELLVCARAPCPAALQPECAEWLANVQRATPSIVVRATDASGKDLGDAKVIVDGKPFLERPDGAPHDLDPGEHQVRIEPAAGAPIEQKVLLSAAEKARLLTLTIASPPPPPASPIDAGPAPPPSRWPAYAFGGLGVAATGGFVYFGATGLSNWNACHVGCSTSHVDAGNRAWIGADVSLGVAVVSFGLATYFFLRPAPKRDRAAAIRVSPAGVGGAF